jgi:hypothetical protein
MRLTAAYAFAKNAGLSPDIITSDLRARLVDFRPSALEKRGEPPLPEIGSCVYGMPDHDRFAMGWGRASALEKRWQEIHLGGREGGKRLARLRTRRNQELATLRGHTLGGHTIPVREPRQPCRLCQLLDVDTSDADALERLLGEAR